MSGDLLFCKLCQHTIDWKCVDTCKDHLRSKDHVKNKEKHCAAAANASWATTSLHTTKLKWEKRNFVKNKMDFTRPWSIPLAKVLALNLELVPGRLAVAAHCSSKTKLHCALNM